MKEIMLPKGYVTLVDDEDFERANKIKWGLGKNNNYAVYSIWKDRKIYSLRLHRFLLGLSFGDKTQVDHINGNGLDNRKENLRLCNNAQNAFNASKQCNNKSGYKGVCSWSKGVKKWRAQIQFNSKVIHIGSFQNKEDAARAYDEAARKYFGEFARLNFPG